MTIGTPAATVVRNWVELYTRGLPPELRHARRAEIESDLWCDVEEAEHVGRGSTSVGVEMLTRLVLGMPADIGWRLSHRAAGASTSRKETAVPEPRWRHLLTAIGIAVVLFDLIAAAGSLDRMEGATVVTVVVGAVLALVGLLVVGRAPLAGGALAVIGGVLVGSVVLIGDPTWIVGYVFFAPIVVIGVVRSWQVVQAQRQQAART